MQYLFTCYESTHLILPLQPEEERFQWRLGRCFAVKWSAFPGYNVSFTPQDSESSISKERVPLFDKCSEMTEQHIFL